MPFSLPGSYRALLTAQSSHRKGVVRLAPRPAHVRGEMTVNIHEFDHIVTHAQPVEDRMCSTSSKRSQRQQEGYMFLKVDRPVPFWRPVLPHVPLDKPCPMLYNIQYWKRYKID